MKYEYLVRVVAFNEDEETELNLLGREGWELVCIGTGGYFVLKRVLID